MNRREFLSKFDFAGYVFARFSPVIETSDDDRVRVICPMCDDKSGHLYVLLSAGLPFCQKCKYDPKSPVRFIADVDNITFSEVIRMCGESFGHPDMSVEEVVDDLFEEEEEGYFEYEVMDMPTDVATPFFESGLSTPLATAFKKARAYLEGRGVTREQVRQYDMKYCYFGQYGGRLIIPCFYKGDLVTFVARDIFGHSSRKYLNPIGNKQSDFLFNLDNVKGDSVVLTEGVFDAISASLVAPAVASFGKSLSARQMRLLNQFKRVVFYWDADAYPQAEKYAEALHTDCLVVKHYDGKDAGSRSYTENEALIKSAVRFDSVDYEMFKLVEMSC